MNFKSLFEEKYRQAKAGRLKPSTLALETTNICNASCVMCPRHLMTRAQGVMDHSLHQAIIDKFNMWRDSIRTVSHAGIGEPLMDNRLAEKIKYEKSFFKDVAVNVYTNGSLMNANRALELGYAGTNLISVSVNAYYEDSYTKIMNLPMKKTVSNILEARDVLKGSGTRLMVSLIPQPLLKHDEIDRFSEFWARHDIQSNIPPLINWGGNTEFCESSGMLKAQFPCFYLWEVILIDWEGKCRVCCEDFDSKWSPGSILDKTPDKLFNSNYMNHFRKMHIEGNFRFCPMCEKCIESGESAELYWRSLSQ